MTRLAATLIVACTPAAWGQAGWLLTTTYEPGQTSVNPAHPTASVRVSAFFPPQDYAYAGSNFDFIAAEGQVGWGGAIPPFRFGTNPGFIEGPVWRMILLGQLNFPPANVFADARNPIPILDILWTTDDFRSRSVDVTTRTVRFDVYPERLSPASGSRMSMLVEGRGIIVVTPPPGGLLGIGVAAMSLNLRRHRSRKG